MTTRIDFETVKDDLQRYPTASPEEKARIKKDLDSWNADYEEQVAIEAEESRKKHLRVWMETEQKMERMFTYSETWDGQWTQEKQRYADMTPDPVESKAAMANARWFSHMEGKPVDEIVPHLSIYKDAYSKKFFSGNPKTQKEFYDALGSAYQKRNDQQAAMNELYGQIADQTLTDALYGMNSSFAVGMAKWAPKYGHLFDEEQEADFLKRAFELGYQFRYGLEGLKQPAAKGLDVLTRFTQGEASSDDVLQFAREFTKLPREDREKALMFMGVAAKARLVTRENFEQFAKNLGESISRSFDFFGKAGLASMERTSRLWLNQLKINHVHMGPSGNPRQGPAMLPGSRELTDEEKLELEEQFLFELETYQVVRELKDFAKRAVDPVIPVFVEETFLGTMEQGLYGLGGSTGFLVASAIPYTFGMGGLLAYQSENYDRIRLENPDIDPTVAGQLALLEAGGNVVLDRMQLKRLPALGHLFRDVKSNGWRNTAKGTGKIWTEQSAQELVQNGIAPVVETIAASLRTDMVKRDAGEEFEKYVADIPVTLASTAWLAFIGGGLASITDIKNPRRDLDLALEVWGFNKEQADRIRAAQTPEEFDTAVRQEMPKRAPENIEAGRQKAEEMYRAAEQAEATPDAPRLDSRTVNGITQWIVTDADGKEVFRHKDFEVAAKAHDELQVSRHLSESPVESKVPDASTVANDAPYGISKEGSRVIKYNADAQAEWKSAQTIESDGQEIFGASDFPSGGKLKDIIARVKAWGQSHGLFAKHPTPALNAEVEIRPRAISNDLSHGASDDKIKSVASLPKLLANAVHIQTEENPKNRGMKHHVLAAKLKFAGEDHIVSLVIREQNGHLFYDHEFVEKAKGEPTSRAWSGITTRHGLSEGSPSTGNVVRSALGVNSDTQPGSTTNPQSHATSSPNERRLSLSEKAEENPSTAPDHGGKLLAPNGKPSNLSTEQWHLVRTPEFKQWFGDWEAAGHRDFLSGPPVVELIGNEFPKIAGESLIDRVAQWFSLKWGGKVNHPIIGEIAIDRRGARDSVAHGIGREKAAAFAAVPQILTHGRIISTTSGYKDTKGLDRFIVCAPIKMGGQDYIGVAIVQRDEKGSRFYLHEVGLKEKLQTSSKTASTVTDGGDRADAGAIKTLLSDIFSVNPETVNKTVDENGEPRIFERSQRLDQSTKNPENTNDSDSPENLKSSESASGRPNERPSWLTSDFEARINSDREAPRITRPEAEAALRDIEAAGGGATGSFQFVNRGELRARQSAGMDAAEHLAALFGRRVVVFHNGEKPWINGITNTLHPDKIFINADSGRPYWSVAGHELWHHLQMERPELADQTWNALRDGLRNFDKYEQMRRADGYSEREIPNELLGDALADAMADPGFWSRLSQRNPSLFERFAQAVKDWLDRVIHALKNQGFGTDRFFQDFESAKDVLAEALARFGTKDSAGKLGPYLPGDPNQNHYSGGRDPSLEGLPKVGQPFNSEKKKIPKAAGRTTSDVSRLPQRDWLRQVTEWLEKTEAIIDPDGERVILQNPEKGSLEKRAFHLIASYDRQDTYQQGERKLSPAKARTVFLIQRTIEDYQVKAIDERGQLAYFRRYEDGTLHMVIVERATGKLQEHRLITQRALDNKSGAKGFTVLASRTFTMPSITPSPEIPPNSKP